MYQINSKQPIYDPAAVQPMRDELTLVGFEEMLTLEAVEKNLNVKDDKTRLIFINSVCGCSAGSARPGVSLALQNKKIPHHYLTSFAGNDRDAVDVIRNNYLSQHSPTSPAIAIVKNEETIYYMGRPDIIGKSPDEISEILSAVFNSIDGKEGPSVVRENYDNVLYSASCGSKIPLNNN